MRKQKDMQKEKLENNSSFLYLTKPYPTRPNRTSPCPASPDHTLTLVKHILLYKYNNICQFGVVNNGFA